jgi:hypothetical protein
MDMRKKLLGAEHPHTFLSMGNLANIYGSQGRWNEAEQLEIQVMDMRKKLLGAEHPVSHPSHYGKSSMHIPESGKVE